MGLGSRQGVPVAGNNLQEQSYIAYHLAPMA